MRDKLECAEDRPSVCNKRRAGGRPSVNEVLIDDGGRKQVFPQEKLDCTVRAVAWATGMGYKKAHALLAKHGRKSGKPFGLQNFLRYSAPFIARAFEYHGTFGRFAREHQKGNFIVRSSGHCAPVIDGVLIDISNSSLCRVKRAWEIL